MKCILCKICEAANTALERKMHDWTEAQIDKTLIWEREFNHERILYAYELQKTDPVQSFKEYLALAEQGSVWSMVPVGIDFENGIGTAVDLAQSEKWYRRAYEERSDYGLLALGRFYLRSERYLEAEQIFQSGLERGFVPAMYRLAWTYWKSGRWSQNREEILVMLERASAAGDLYARRFLANTMLHGWFGWRRVPEGFRLLSRVADDLAALMKDEEPATLKKDRNGPLGLFGHLARVFWLSAQQIPAS